MKNLLQHNADVNLTNNNDIPPFIFAIIYKKTDMVKFLVKNGADVNYLERYQGWTPLHCAVASPWVLRLPLPPKKVLLVNEKKFNVENNIQMVQILLDYGADPNKNERFAFEKTPLELASSYYNDVRIKQLLIQHGALPGRFSKRLIPEVLL